MNSVVENILEDVRAALASRRRAVPVAELEARLSGAPPVRPFLDALTATEEISVIAEVKRRSPSRGDLRPGLEPTELGREYAEAGATCLSVLTEERSFGGSLRDLREARKGSGLPVLRKEFILDPYQIVEARAHGADAILLIVAILDDAQLDDFLALSAELELTPLVEVHSDEDLTRALEREPPLLGVNSRDLETLNLDRNRVAQLRPRIPDGQPLVAESGIRGPADIPPLRELGISAILVGTHLVSAPHPGLAVEELVEACRR